MGNKQIFYSDFDHPASQLSAYTLCIDIFIISLKNGEIVRFKPVDIVHFEQWLKKHSVRDIAVDNGMPKNIIKPHLPKQRNYFINLFKLNKNEK